MNPEWQPRSNVTTFVHDAGNRLTKLPDRTAEPGKTPAARPEPTPPAPPTYTIEHDPDKGIYRVRWSDGKVEVFRARPVRNLVLEPDRQTGELKPAIARGYPTYRFLCREEHEVR